MKTTVNIKLMTKTDFGNSIIKKHDAKAIGFDTSLELEYLENDSELDIALLIDEIIEAIKALDLIKSGEINILQNFYQTKTSIEKKFIEKKNIFLKGLQKHSIYNKEINSMLSLKEIYKENGIEIAFSYLEKLVNEYHLAYGEKNNSQIMKKLIATSIKKEAINNISRNIRENMYSSIKNSIIKNLESKSINKAASYITKSSEMLKNIYLEKLDNYLVDKSDILKNIIDSREYSDIFKKVLNNLEKKLESTEKKEFLIVKNYIDKSLIQKEKLSFNILDEVYRNILREVKLKKIYNHSNDKTSESSEKEINRVIALVNKFSLQNLNEKVINTIIEKKTNLETVDEIKTVDFAKLINIIIDTKIKGAFESLIKKNISKEKYSYKSYLIQKNLVSRIKELDLVDKKLISNIDLSRAYFEIEMLEKDLKIIDKLKLSEINDNSFSSFVDKFRKEIKNSEKLYTYIKEKNLTLSEILYDEKDFFSLSTMKYLDKPKNEISTENLNNIISEIKDIKNELYQNYSLLLDLTFVEERKIKENIEKKLLSKVLKESRLQKIDKSFDELYESEKHIEFRSKLKEKNHSKVSLIDTSNDIFENIIYKFLSFDFKLKEFKNKELFIDNKDLKEKTSKRDSLEIRNFSDIRSVFFNDGLETKIKDTETRELKKEALVLLVSKIYSHLSDKSYGEKVLKVDDKKILDLINEINTKTIKTNLKEEQNLKEKQNIKKEQNIKEEINIEEFKKTLYKINKLKNLNLDNREEKILNLVFDSLNVIKLVKSDSIYNGEIRKSIYRLYKERYRKRNRERYIENNLKKIALVDREISNELAYSIVDSKVLEKDVLRLANFENVFTKLIDISRIKENSVHFKNNYILRTTEILKNELVINNSKLDYKSVEKLSYDEKEKREQESILALDLRTRLLSDLIFVIEESLMKTYTKKTHTNRKNIEDLEIRNQKNIENQSNQIKSEIESKFTYRKINEYINENKNEISSSINPSLESSENTDINFSYSDTVEKEKKAKNKASSLATQRDRILNTNSKNKIGKDEVDSLYREIYKKIEREFNLSRKRIGK